MIRQLLTAIYTEIVTEFREFYGIHGNEDTLEYDQMWRDIDNQMSVRCHGSWWKEVDF